ncbi:MAG: hypothetical protein ABSF91_12940 [Bacteroidota bacterium]
MTIDRREFLKVVGAGALATSLPAGAAHADSPQKEQGVPQDFYSNKTGTEYFFLGNGLIMAALQTSPSEEAGTHCGLLLMSPEHFARKNTTYLFHPERGLLHSRFYVIVDGTLHAPEFVTSRVHWEYPGNIPTVVIDWAVGSIAIREELMCPSNDPVILRTVTLENAGSIPHEVTGRLFLYPNLGFFDEYHVDREHFTLQAKGYQTLELFATNATSAGDRSLDVDFEELYPKEKKSTAFILTLNYPRKEFEGRRLAAVMEETKKYWSRCSQFDFDDASLNHLFLTSRSGIRAAVAHSGKLDGGIWQYNMEWVRDQSMVAAAASMTGQLELAAAILTRILTSSVNEDGKTVDASRHRTTDTVELDQNGELIYGLYTNWVWSGSDAILKLFWEKIKKVAEYALQQPFLDPESGLVKNKREYWERDASFGVKEGFELTYQFWNIIGLELASSMASHMKDDALAENWLQASLKMKRSFLQHPRFSLVDEGKFIKRRLTTGEVQRTLEPLDRKTMPPGMPLNIEKVSFCEPDSASVYPIIFEMVDPSSSLATNTMESMEELWNQRWDIGGYGRYHVTSEPDSPGAWPIATLFIMRAYQEAGNYEKVKRALDWMSTVQGGKAGAWQEFYGQRPVPPLPPVGILPWTWAELILFFVHHVVGIRPAADKLRIRPKLIAGIHEIQGEAVIHGHRVHVAIRRDPVKQFAVVEGTSVPLKQGILELDFPDKDISVEIHVS